MKRLLTATAMLMASAVLAHAEGELQLYNWGDYTSPELLAKFEKETGIKVTVTDYDSNDTALAKIEAGGAGFDLVVPSANYVPIYVEKGLVQELDLSKIPNHKNIAEEWLNVDYDPGRKYSIPWQWGTTGVAVNQKAYSGDINTSAIWLDPPPELVGKVNVAADTSKEKPSRMPRQSELKLTPDAAFKSKRAAPRSYLRRRCPCSRWPPVQRAAPPPRAPPRAGARRRAARRACRQR